MQLLTEWRIAYTLVKANIASALQLRLTFALQVFGMMLNDMAFVVLWTFFFKAFGAMNGWSTHEVLAFVGVSAFAFGGAFSGFAGVLTLPELVNNGSFDNLLLSPRSVYWRILTSRTRVSAIGDMLFGLLLVIIYVATTQVSGVQIAMLFSLLIPATIIMVNVTLITSLVSFFMPDAGALAQNLFDAFNSPSLYPSAVFPSVLKFVFIFVIPSLVMGGVPLEAVVHKSAVWYSIIWAIAIVWTVIAHKLLAISLRHYESGNLTGARAD